MRAAVRPASCACAQGGTTRGATLHVAKLISTSCAIISVPGAVPAARDLGLALVKPSTSENWRRRPIMASAATLDPYLISRQAASRRDGDRPVGCISTLVTMTSSLARHLAANQTLGCVCTHRRENFHARQPSSGLGGTRLQGPSGLESRTRTSLHGGCNSLHAASSVVLVYVLGISIAFVESQRPSIQSCSFSPLGPTRLVIPPPHGASLVDCTVHGGATTAIPQLGRTEGYSVGRHGSMTCAARMKKTGL